MLRNDRLVVVLGKTLKQRHEKSHTVLKYVKLMYGH